MAKNKYVDFVSDEDFLECVKTVCDKYSDDSKDWKGLKENGLDVFKLMFDMKNNKKTNTLKKWKKAEDTRQKDKTVTNNIGNFHQILLGKVEGWDNLDDDKHKEIKKELKVDLMNTRKTKFIEIKNKSNTKTGTDLNRQYKKLKNITENYPKATAYFGFVLSKHSMDNTKDEVWESKGEKNEKVRKVWGSKLYELVTDKENALEQTWKALPKAIDHLLKPEKSVVSKEDKKEIKKLFKEGLG